MDGWGWLGDNDDDVGPILSLTPSFTNNTSQHTVKQQRKIRASEYAALKEFAADVELMVDNALTFNREGEPVHTFAKETRQLFYKQLAKHKEDYALREDEE